MSRSDDGWHLVIACVKCSFLTTICSSISCGTSSASTSIGSGAGAFSADESSSEDDAAAKDLGVPVDALYYHGVALDLAKPLKAQGVFRDPALLEWK